VKKRPLTLNEAGSTETQRDEADYAVVRPTDVADNDDDDSGDYAYPAASVPDSNPGRRYLDLLPEPDDPLQLLVVLTRPETNITTSASRDYSDVTKMATTIMEDDEIHSSDALDSATDEQPPATYIEII